MTSIHDYPTLSYFFAYYFQFFNGVLGSSIDYSKLAVQLGDVEPIPFSEFSDPKGI